MMAPHDEDPAFVGKRASNNDKNDGNNNKQGEGEHKGVVFIFQCQSHQRDRGTGRDAVGVRFTALVH